METSRGQIHAASVVIVGGGAIGASTAFHLTELGITDVVLVERDVLASGSTSKSAGGFRTQFTDELNLSIARRSLPEIETFESRMGEIVDYVPSIGLRQHGYLILIDNDADLERFSVAVGLQAKFGFDTQILTPEEIRARVPQVRLEGLLAGSFNARDGQVTPEAVTQGYAAAAAQRGVRILQGATVRGIESRADRIVAVDTSKGRIATNTVVCAAGVWSRELAALVGVDVPVRPERRWSFYSPTAELIPRGAPLTVDFSTGLYVHPEGPGLVFGGRESTLDELAAIAVARVPVLERAEVQSSWWGYYEMSPDHNAIVGEAPTIHRFLVATGFSGHGFQQAPAIGEHIAELVAGVPPTLELDALSLDRFDADQARVEYFVI